jgi:acyl-CoA synthetase (AMP-forming)/AMP-acid ligase II
MTAMEVTRRVPVGRANSYRVSRLWDDRGLHDGLETAAERRPDVTAVDGPDGRLTFAELVRSVGRAMSELTTQGVRPGDSVLLIAGNSTLGVVAYHALLRLGATILFLDRRCGAADVKRAMELLTEPARVVAPSGMSHHAKEHNATVLSLESLVATGLVGSVEWLEPGRDKAALVLFTSGTTARPKGVIHSLNTLTAGARNLAHITQASEATVLFLVSPLSSIAGIMQVHLAADVGASLVLDDHFDPPASLDRLNAVSASLLGGAPVIAERLLGEASHRDGGHVSLGTLALGGAMLPRPLLETAMDRFAIDVVRVYGSSEAPNFSGSDPSDPRDARLADDGALQPGSEVRVGSSSHPQEGLVRGPAVCLGYVDEEDSREAFEDGWFRTGDLLEVRDGRLTVVGRLKEIVNRNGFKISPAEVESALAGLSGVRECACFGVPDPATGERLAVAVVPDVGVVVTLDDVLDHLVQEGVSRRKFPELLFVREEPLPRTASGKVIRARLA